jgi:hypothetical protein
VGSPLMRFVEDYSSANESRVVSRCMDFESAHMMRRNAEYML